MPPIRKPRKPRKLFSHHHAGAGTIWGLTEIHLPRLRTGCEVSDFSEVSDFGEKAHIRGLGRANTSCWTSSRRWSVPPGLEDAASSTAAQKPVRNKDNSEHSRSNPQNNPQKFMALRPPTLYVLAMPTVTTPSTSRTRAVDPQVRPLRWAGKAHTRQGTVVLCAPVGTRGPCRRQPQRSASGADRSTGLDAGPSRPHGPAHPGNRRDGRTHWEAIFGVEQFDCSRPRPARSTGRPAVSPEPTRLPRR